MTGPARWDRTTDAHAFNVPLYLLSYYRKNGERGRTRTCVGRSQRVYSAPQLPLWHPNVGLAIATPAGKLSVVWIRARDGCGGRDRTYDRRVNSTPHYLCATPHDTTPSHMPRGAVKKLAGVGLARRHVHTEVDALKSTHARAIFRLDPSIRALYPIIHRVSTLTFAYLRHAIVGGSGGSRTHVGLRHRIKSPPPSATRSPIHNW